jgi:hypothetical protein
MAGTLTLGYSLEGQGTLTNEVPSVITSAFDSIGINLPLALASVLSIPLPERLPCWMIRASTPMA